MNSARVQSILFEADGPQILVLRDTVDTRWIGLATSRKSDGDEYLCVQVSRGRLADFRHGKLDLREMFVNPEVPVRCRASIADELVTGVAFELVPVSGVAP